jgi:hypothetical protein
MKITATINSMKHTFTEEDIFRESENRVICITKYGHWPKKLSTRFLIVPKKVMATIERDCERVSPLKEDEQAEFKLLPLGIRLATHKHYKISGLYRIRERTLGMPSISLRIVRDCVDFWDKPSESWMQSNATKQTDLIELTAAEKVSL